MKLYWQLKQKTRIIYQESAWASVDSYYSNFNKLLQSFTPQPVDKNSLLVLERQNSEIKSSKMFHTQVKKKMWKTNFRQ